MRCLKYVYIIYFFVIIYITDEGFVMKSKRLLCGSFIKIMLI